MNNSQPNPTVVQALQRAAASVQSAFALRDDAAVSDAMSGPDGLAYIQHANLSPLEQVVAVAPFLERVPELARVLSLPHAAEQALQPNNPVATSIFSAPQTTVKLLAAILNNAYLASHAKPFLLALYQTRKVTPHDLVGVLALLEPDVASLAKVVPTASLTTVELVTYVFEKQYAAAGGDAQAFGIALLLSFTRAFDTLGAGETPDARFHFDIRLFATELISFVNTKAPDFDWSALLPAVFARYPPGTVPLLFTFTALFGLCMFQANQADGNQLRALLTGLFVPWPEHDLQLFVLAHLLKLDAETCTPLASLPVAFKILAPEHIQQATRSPGVIQTVTSAKLQSSILNCDGYAKAVLGVLKADEANERLQLAVKNILEQACILHPDLVFLGLIEIENPIASSLLSSLMSSFLANHATFMHVFVRLNAIDGDTLLSTLEQYYIDDSEHHLHAVLDIAYESNVLESITRNHSTTNVQFALDLAALASRRGYLDLESYLSERLETVGASFGHAMLEIVFVKCKRELADQMAGRSDGVAETIYFTSDICSTFLRALRSHRKLIVKDDIDFYREVRTKCMQLHPRLMNFLPDSQQPDREVGMSVVRFDAETEAECDKLYKKMYDMVIPVESVVDALKKAKESDDAQDHVFFACFLHGIFDERRFFSTYPLRELKLTASLFGDLIEYQLLSIIPMGIAVRYVLDALSAPPDSNWFSFGIEALSRFQGRLAQWPQLAQSVLDIPHLGEHHPQLVSLAQDALAQRSVHRAETAHAKALDEEKPVPLVFTAVRAEPSVDAAAPPDDVSDPILFIVNNLAPSNLEEKVAALGSKLAPEYYTWFAQYLVTQRVSIEPNNHALYLAFLDSVGEKALIATVLRETYARVCTLINADLTVQSSTERTLLKNLGAWLGGLTLARNLPILHRHIAFKTLLREGYQLDRLIVAIPFVCKVLEQAKDSRVFRPPNPWLMGVVRALVELYHVADLKLNLTFEIEVLCKSLGLDIATVEPATELQERLARDEQAAALRRAQAARQQQLRQISQKQSLPPGMSPVHAQLLREHGQGATAPVPAAYGANPALTSVFGAEATGDPANTLQEAATRMLQAAAHNLHFPSLPALEGNTSVRRLVLQAFDRAIRDVLVAVVERSITIASVSTRDLILKDFAMEGDETKMAQVAHLTAQRLAASLALITCKDVLRGTIVHHLRLLLHNFDTKLSDASISLIANDNIELCCSVIERLTMQRAQGEMDTLLADAYKARREHRAAKKGTAFWDSAAISASHYSGMLPPPLSLSLGGLSQEQLDVYLSFGQVGGTTPATVAGPAAGFAGAPAAAASGPLLAEISKLLLLPALPRDESRDESLRHLVHSLFATLSNKPDEVLMHCLKQVIQILFSGAADARASDVYGYILDRICKSSTRCAKEMGQWLASVADERRFRVPPGLYVTLARVGALDLREWDAALGKTVLASEFRPDILDFACKFVFESSLSREQLPLTVEAVLQAQRFGKATDAARKVALAVQRLAPNVPIATAPANGNSVSLDAAARRDQMVAVIDEWTQVYKASSAHLDRPFVEFASKLQKKGWLAGEEQSSLFFRVCTEYAVDQYINGKANMPGDMARYESVDAFAYLISLMIKYHTDSSGERAKVHYMSKVLSIVIAVLAKAHEEYGPHFDQKPFFRFFSTFFTALSDIEASLDSATYMQALIVLGQFLNTIQPRYFPGFAFSWIALISHRLFMPKLLAKGPETAIAEADVPASEYVGYAAMTRLLVSLVTFLAPFYDGTHALTASTRALYDGTMRIFLVLLHDFPDFLAQIHTSLCDVLPLECIQLRNLVCSAYPVSFAPGFSVDPSLVQLSIEQVPMIFRSPPQLFDFSVTLSASGTDLKRLLDSYLRLKEPTDAPAQLLQRLAEGGDTLTVVNALVMYVAVVGINEDRLSAPDGTQTIAFKTDTAPVHLLEQLLLRASYEQRYKLIVAMVTQLRYPNSHTYWLAEFVLHAFVTLKGAAAEVVREQIVRVVLERIVVYKPHPWGLVYIFIRLIKDSNARLMERSFVTRSPEIKTLFKQVSTVIAA